MTNTIFKNNTKIGNPYDFLDRNRHRKMVFYGRVSTEHEAQMAALENQIEWYDDQAKHHPNWEVLNKYIDEHAIIGTSGENLVKSRVSALVPFNFMLRASTISFKSQNIIMEGCANHVKNNRSMQ